MESLDDIPLPFAGFRSDSASPLYCFIDWHTRCNQHAQRDPHCGEVNRFKAKKVEGLFPMKTFVSSLAILSAMAIGCQQHTTPPQTKSTPVSTTPATVTHTTAKPVTEGKSTPATPDTDQHKEADDEIKKHAKPGTVDPVEPDSEDLSDRAAADK